MAGMSALEARRRILMNTPHIVSELGEGIVTFDTDMTANLKDCKIYFEPVQEGTGDPSPDNVRPISGWDGVTVYKSGKNLVDVQDMKDTYPWTTATYKAYALYVGSNKTVTVSYNWAPVNGHNFYICLGVKASERNKSNVPIAQWMYHKTSGSYDKQKCTVTVDSDGYLYINVYTTNLSDFYSCILDNNFQVEYGTEKTTYEPFKSFDQLIIPFPQTIYGGYVDLVNGEVVEEWAIDTYTDSDAWIATTVSGQPAFQVRRKQIPTSATFVSNLIKRVSSLNSETNNSGYAGGTYLNVKITSAETIDEFKTLLTANPLQTVYQLTTPITHQLTPQVIKTLKGINNIWSDANGNVEIKFWKH